MKKNQRLDQAILTPSTKADKGGHDESVSREEILERGLLRAEEFEEAAAMCARLFAFGQAEAAKRGLILVDTKYEIGRRPDGTLCFIDEIHTPDSSRYWYADDYQARFDRGDEPRGLDKEYVRRTLAEQGYRGEGPPPPLSDEVRCEAARRYIALLRADHRQDVRARHRSAAGPDPAGAERVVSGGRNGLVQRRLIGWRPARLAADF